MKMLFDKLNHLWRILITGFAFVFFGLGGLLILSTLLFNLIRLLIWNRNYRHIIAQNMICMSFKFFLWILKVTNAIDYQFNGLEKLKQDKSCLVIANHPSLLDFVLLTSVMPRCDCMVKESLFNNFFVRGVIKSAGYIANTEANKMLSNCVNTLKAGGRILIFPEGTRSVPNKSLILQRGAANIALRCQADIRIIYINCYPPLLYKGQKWYEVPSKKPFFRITIGEKITIADFYDDNLTLASRKLTQYLTLKLTHQTNNSIPYRENND